jgi:glycosyltransferase involved in cell wall biosynthesis
VRIALLSYRTKDHCGGQGVYVKYLSHGLAELGHEVEVFSGQPYPSDLDPRVRLTKVPSLDVFGSGTPRLPGLRSLRDRYDVVEWVTTATGVFAEPLAFSLRAAHLLRGRAADFDVVHDNQSLGYGLLGRGLPLAATIHHPISRDRKLEIDAVSGLTKLSKARWYSFVRMQARVARRVPVLIGVSEISAADAMTDFAIAPGRFRVVPLGVDTDLFVPSHQRVAGRVVAVASADRPLKGVTILLDALAKLRAVRDVELHLVSTLEPGGPADRRIDELGLRECVTLHSGLSDADLAALLASAEVMCVPSLYEGFSLPTVEALSCGTPVVASRAGALPEVVGASGDCAVLVEPGNVDELAGALDDVLGSPELRTRLGAAGRARALDRFSWISVAQATARAYGDAIDAATARRS